MIDIKRMQQTSVELSQLQEGDLITVDGIQWIVIKAAADEIVVQQYDHIEDYIFNEDNTNTYEGSDLQGYVEQYRHKFKTDLFGDFFILPTEAYQEGSDYPYLQKPENRQRYDEDGHSTWYWTSSPHVGYGSHVRSIYPTGNVSSSNAYYSIGVAPACRLNLESVMGTNRFPEKTDSEILKEIRDLLAEVVKKI